MKEEMHEEQIMRRAQAEVAARRAKEHAPGRPGRWFGRLPGLAVVVLLAFFAAPGPLPHKLLLAMGGVCGLRPSHSFFAGGCSYRWRHA